MTAVLAASSIVLGSCSEDPKPTSVKSADSASAHVLGFNGKTSCSSVMYIGESTSIGMVVPEQIPNQSERLQSRLKDVGVTSLRMDISGGRTSIERFENRPNALDVIPPSFTRSFHGCYFVAIGVNDAANSSFPHSAGTARQRIELVLSRIGNRPVLWPLIRTSPELHGPYAEDNMIRFNDELEAAAKRHPNMRLYDWPSEMQPRWWEGDGIHDKRIGSRERALMYADALAVAFPKGMSKNSARVVGSRWARPALPQNIPTLPAVPQDNMSFWAANSAALKHYTSGPALP